MKAVAQAIPTLGMGCFDLTKTLCDHISTMICMKKNKIHWLSCVIRLAQ